MIIIETPAPPTRERLVLVPLHSVSREANDPSTEPFTVHTNDARDATPADLERAGWVTGEMLAEQVRIVWAAGQKAEPVSVAMLRKLKDRAEKAEGYVNELLADDLRAAARDAMVRAGQAEASLAAAQAAFDESLTGTLDRAEKAERERDEALLRAHTGVVHYEILRQSGEEAARQRDEARAELARLTAPGEGSEGEPTYEDFRARWLGHTGHGAHGVASFAREQWRAGVAHERARQQPAQDRATDEESAVIGREAWNRNIGDDDSITAALRATTLAVAARVRQERCLVAQAVGMGVRYMAIFLEMGGRWGVVVGERVASAQAPADVPATLARLLGEVSRG